MLSRSKKGLAVLSALSLLALTGCGTTGAISGAPTKAEIKTVQVSAQTVSGKLTVSGVFDANHSGVVTTQLPGKIKSINVKEGSQVKKGEVLLTLDTSDLETQLQQAQLNVQKSQITVDQAKMAYDNAEQNYSRSEPLLAAGMISQSQLDQLKMARDVNKSQLDMAVNVGIPAAQAQVTALQQNLAKMTLTSPLDGTVAGMSLNVGDNVMPGGPLVTVISAGDPVLVGNVSESMLGVINAGAAAEVRADAFIGAKFQGAVDFLSPESVSTGQFFPLKVSVKDPQNQIKPGMTGQAVIRVEIPAGLAVSNSAVFRRDGRDYVYLVTDGKAVKKALKIRFQGDTLSSVSEGIAIGDTVVSQGTDAITDGMLVPK